MDKMSMTRMAPPPPRNFLKKRKKELYGVLQFNYVPQHADEFEGYFNDFVIIRARGPSLDAEQEEVTEDEDTSEANLSPGWLLVVSVNGSKRGLIPASYVNEVHEAIGGMATVTHDYYPDDVSGQLMPVRQGTKVLVTDFTQNGDWWAVVDIESSRVGGVPGSYLSLDDPASFSEMEEILFEKDDAGMYKDLDWVIDALDVTVCDSFAKDLVLLFESKGAILDLIRHFIKTEIAQTTSEGTIFRKNGVATYAMTAYARWVGKKYLKDVLRNLIVRVHSTASFEIDPHKMAPEDDLQTNVQALCMCLQEFLHTVMESLNTIPNVLKLICTMLYLLVSESFQKAGRKAVGGFFFLRFICPAIVAPDSIGIIDQMNPKSRRGLILVSKVLQTISNGVQFGQKEPYMIPMNQFIAENLENVHYILDKLGKTPITDSTIQRLQPLSEEDLKQVWKRLHIHLFSVKQKLSKDLLNSVKSNTELTVDYKRYLSVLCRLGPPRSSQTNVTEHAKTLERRVSILLLKDLVPAGSDPRLPARKTSKESSPLTGKTKERKLAKSQDKPRKNAEEKETRKLTKSDVRSAPPKSLPPPAGAVPQCMSWCFKRQHGKKIWHRRWCVLYLKSEVVHFYNAPEDMPGKVKGVFRLNAPGVVATIVGHRKNHPEGCEFTLSQESTGGGAVQETIHLVAAEDKIMKQWIAAVDRRLRELSHPDQPNREILENLKGRLNSFQKQLAAEQTTMLSCPENERAIHEQKIADLEKNILEARQAIINATS